MLDHHFSSRVGHEPLLNFEPLFDASIRVPTFIILLQLILN